jgi:exodeoxyribonuclease VII small subunit
MTEAKKKPSFEEALKLLEKIVTQVEEGKIGLEESIDKYEQGMKLVQQCRAILDQAEKRIETIQSDNETKD